MLADRVRCEGQRLHLEQWLKRGDRTRATVAPHTSKSQKDQTNTNTLTRCRSLELLDDHNFESKMESSTSVLARSYDNMLSHNSTHEVMIHRSAGDEESDRTSARRSRSRSDRKNSGVDMDSIEEQYSNKDKRSSMSEKGRLSYSEKDKNSLGDRSGSDRSKGLRHQIPDESVRDDRGRNEKIRYSVAERLEELLSKTNEIIHMERMARKRSKQGFTSIMAEGGESRKHRSKSSPKLKVSTSSKSCSGYEDDLIRQLGDTSISQSAGYHHTGHRDTSFIAQEMEKITSSLLGYGEEEMDEINGGPVSPEIAKECGNQKEVAAGIDHEKDRSSALSGSSYRSIYVPSTGSKRSVSSSEDKRRHKDSNFIDDTQIDNGNDGKSDETHGGLCGFYQNSCFDDVPSSSSNTIKSDRTQKTQCELGQISENGTLDSDDRCELSEMANMKELNELKSRILNGSHWRSQVLRKGSQDINQTANRDMEFKEDVQTENDAGKEHFNTVRNIDENPESATDIFALPPRMKVNELVAKIQGTKGTGKMSQDHEPNENDHVHSESSDAEDDDMDFTKTPMDHQEQIVRPPQIVDSDSGICIGQDFQKTYRSFDNIIPPDFQGCPPLHPKPTALRYRSPVLQPYQAQRIIDTRCLIPKDAYFHELPNKNKMKPITDNLPEKHLLGNGGNSSNFIPTIPYTSAGPRNRNPLSMNQSILYDSRPQTLVMPSYIPPNVNYSQPSYYHLPIIPITEEPKTYQPLGSQNRPHPEKLLSNRKFGANPATDGIYQRNYERIDSSTLSIPLEITGNNPGIGIDPNCQMERESNNDSGYSTKISGGSSMGPSPSLSGHTDPELIMGTAKIPMTNAMSSAPHPPNTNYDRYYMSSFGASSLV